MGKAALIIPYHPPVAGKPPLRRLISQTYTFLVNTLSGYCIRYYVTVECVVGWGQAAELESVQPSLVSRRCFHFAYLRAR